MSGPHMLVSQSPFGVALGVRGRYSFESGYMASPFCDNKKKPMLLEADIWRRIFATKILHTALCFTKHLPLPRYPSLLPSLLPPNASNYPLQLCARTVGSLVDLADLDQTEEIPLQHQQVLN